MFVKDPSHFSVGFKAVVKTASAISLFCVSVVGLLGQQPASAYEISVPGYDTRFIIQVQTTAFPSLNPPATQMPWWGNQAIANTFATALGSELGSLLENLGPFFAWETSGSRVFMDAFCIGAPCLGELGAAGAAFSFGPESPVDPPNSTNPFPWAIATPVPSTRNVPGPLPLFGAATAFGFSRKLRVRIKASKTPGSTPPSI